MSKIDPAARSLAKYAEQITESGKHALVYFGGQRVALKQAELDEDEWPSTLIGTTIKDSTLMISLTALLAVEEQDDL